MVRFDSDLVFFNMLILNKGVVIQKNIRKYSVFLIYKQKKHYQPFISG